MRAKARNSRIQVLGMVAIAMVALSAMAASAAQAHVFKSAVAPAVLTGTNEEGTENTFTVSGQVVTCEDSHFVATQSKEASESLTIVPQYSNASTEVGRCASGEASVLVNVNHCAYVLSSNTEEATEGQEHAHLDVECAEGNEIKVEIPALFITLSVPPQTGTTHGLHYYNIEEEYEEGKTVSAVTVEITIKNIEVTCIGFGCSLLGGEHLTAETGGREIATGYEDTGENLDGTTAATTQENYSHGEAPIDIEVEGAPSK